MFIRWKFTIFVLFNMRVLDSYNRYCRAVSALSGDVMWADMCGGLIRCEVGGWSLLRVVYRPAYHSSKQHH